MYINNYDYDKANFEDNQSKIPAPMENIKYHITESENPNTTKALKEN